MKKKRLPIGECQCGDILADDVLNQHGAALVFKHTVINQFIRQKLMDWGITHINIYDLPLSGKEPRSAGHLPKSVLGSYMDHILSLKEIVCELSVYGKLDIKKLDLLCDSLFNYIQESSLFARQLANIREHDDYTYHHSINVSFYSMLIAKWMKKTETEIRYAILTGLLHDIGKTKIPSGLLNKKQALSREEFSEIRKHALYGYDILKNTGSIPDEVCRSVLLHHEREDGSGYPYGLKGNSILQLAKVIAIADVFDAMTSDRIYKSAVCPFDVFDMFLTEGLKIFDINILMLFCRNISMCYINSKVYMEDGAKGEIVYVPPYNISKPVVRVGKQFIDLSKETGHRVLRMATESAK